MATISVGPERSPVIPINTTAISAVSTDVGIYIKYVGSAASGTVEVADATGDLTFKHGVLASEAVDPTIDSGGDDDGVIDVSDATANTFGKVVDMINASANWSARLGGVTRANLTANSLILLAATQAKGVEVGCLMDTTVVRATGLYGIGIRVTRESLFGGSNGGASIGATMISGIGSSAGAHSLRVFEENPITKVTTQILHKTLATATAYEFNDVDFGALGAVWAKPGSDLVIQHIADTATITAPQMNVFGVAKFQGNSGVGSRSAPISGM